MPGPLRAAVLATAAALVLARPAAAAPGDLFGKDAGPFGTVTLRFSHDYAVVTLSRRLAKTAAGKSFVVSCRTVDGPYLDVVGILPLSRRRTIRGPASEPDGAYRCRIRRSNMVLVATMTMARV